MNECEPQPCKNGQCIDKLDGFLCSCEPGYEGKRLNNGCLCAFARIFNMIAFVAAAATMSSAKSAHARTHTHTHTHTHTVNKLYVRVIARRVIFYTYVRPQVATAVCARGDFLLLNEPRATPQPQR